jgi:hypothetical protein
MQAYQASGRFKVVGDAWRFVYRADGLRVVREKVSQAVVADGGGEAGGSSRTEYLYDGQCRCVSKSLRMGYCNRRG